MSLSYEEKIAGCLKQAICDKTVIELLVPNGLMHGYETEIWDYKIGYIDHPPHPNDVDKVKIDLVKDITCLYNCFGGYILIGFPAIFSTNAFQFLHEADHLRDVLRHYTNADIQVKICRESVSVNSELSDVLLIYCPKRKEVAPTYFTKGAPAIESRQSFKKTEVWFRDGHRNQLLADKPEKIGFITGPRELDLRAYVPHAVETLHNLPPRDPNLLRFIGREDYIRQLWAWENDQRDPIRVLSAIGGTGKTAIAYEFCEQLLLNSSTRYDKIIWLTAKSQTFAALLQNYVSTTRMDFTDIESLVDALLLELACDEEELSEYSVDEKEEFLQMMLTDFNVFLVIDDVDSLIPTQQSELFSITTRLFYKANALKSSSRVLLTSRLELAAGAAQLIHVAGFYEQEAKDYVELTGKHLRLTLDQMGEIYRSFDLLYKAAKGSPIFIASILKMVAMGEAIAKAIETWAGQSGEEVRKFAFRREIEALSYREARALFAMQVLSITSLDELCEILREDKFSVQEHLAKLRQYQMFVGASDASRGASISVPEPIRLMVGITEQQLKAKDANDIKARCARAKRDNKSTDEVRRRIGHVSMLWKQKRIEEARLACELAIKQFPKNGDLNCLLGRTYLTDEINDPRRADNAFKEANFKRCERPELADYWAEAKFKLRDWSGVIEVTSEKNSYPVKGRPTALRMSALYIRAVESLDRADFGQALKQFETLCEDGLQIIKDGRAESALETVERVVSHAASHQIDILVRFMSDADSLLRALELIVSFSSRQVRLLSPAYDLIASLPAARRVIVEQRGTRFARSNLLAILDKATGFIGVMGGKSNIEIYVRPIRLLVQKIKQLE